MSPESQRLVSERLKTLHTELTALKNKADKASSKKGPFLSESTLESYYNKYTEKYTEYFSLLNNPDIANLDPTGKVTVPVANRIQALVRITKMLTSVAKQNFKAGKSATKAEFRWVRGAISSLINTPGLDKVNKNRLQALYKNINSVEQFSKRLPAIEREVSLAMENNTILAVKDGLAKLINIFEGNKMGAAREIRLDPETQKIADAFLEEYSNPEADSASALARLGQKDSQENRAKLTAAQLATGKDPVTGQPLSSKQYYNLYQDLVNFTTRGEFEGLVKKNAFVKSIKALKDKIKTEILGGKPQEGNVPFSDANTWDKILSFAPQFGRTYDALLGLVFRHAGGTVGGSYGEALLDVHNNLRIAEINRLYYTGQLDNAYKEVYNLTDKQVMEKFRKDHDIYGDSKVTIPTDKGPLDFTKAEAIEKYMLLQSDIGRKKLEGDGWTQPMFDELNRQMLSEDIEYANKLFKMYDELYDVINETFRKVKGFDLPRREFYSTIYTEQEERTGYNFLSIVQDAFSAKNSADAANILNKGFLKSVTNADVKLKPISATVKMESYIKSATYFSAMAEKSLFMNEIFGDKEIRSAIESKYGKDVTMVLDTFRDALTTNSARKSTDKLSMAMNQFINRFSAGVLAIKPSLFLKQLMSAPFSIMEIGWSKYVEGLADLPRAIESGEIAAFLNHPYIKARYKFRTGSQELRFVQDMIQSAREGRGDTWFSKFDQAVENPQLAQILFLPTQLGDLGGILGNGWPVYKALREKGMTEDEAMKVVIRHTDRTQQSGGFDQMSALMLDDHPLMRSLTRFTGAPTLYMSAAYRVMDTIGTERSYKRDANGEIIKGPDGKPVVDWQKFANMYMVIFILLPSIFDFVSDAFRWDKDELPSKAILGPFSSAPIVGPMLEWAVINATKKIDNLATGDKKTYMRAPDFGLYASMFNNITQANNALQKALKDGVTPEEFFDIINEVAEASTPVTGGLGGAVRAGSNALEGLYLGLEGDFVDTWRRYLMTLGFSKSSTKPK